MNPVERLVHVLLRLHPPHFRARFASEVERAAREDLMRVPRSRSALVVIADLLWTLARAWGHEVRAASERLLSQSVGVAVAALGDARLALRGLVREPLQGFVVVATLALAIGANASIFAATHALLLRALPYEAPDRIVRINRGPDLEDVDDPHPMLEAVAIYFPRGGGNLAEEDQASRVRITQVSPSFFRVLGVDLLLGPGLPPEEEEGGAAVLSHAFWTQAYGRDAGVIGRLIELSGRRFRVAGVAPPDVDFPAGTQLWLSLPVVSDLYGGPALRTVLGRMRSGVLPLQLESELARLRRAERPDVSELPVLFALRDDLTGPVRLPLLVLSAAAGLVLLLGCLNVAGVTLARLWARDEELSVRRALGAGRARIFRQLLAESAALAVLGGAASLGVVWAGVPVLRTLLPAETPGLVGVRPGSATVLAAFAATVLAGFLAGLPAALVARRPSGSTDATRTTRGRRSARLHTGLAATQLALAVVLVTGAALLGGSLSRLHRVPMGFDTDVLTFEVSLPRSSYPDGVSREAYRRRLTEALSAIPGVSLVGSSSRLPLADHLWIGWTVEVHETSNPRPRISGALAVSDAYFSAMGISILEGRTFEPSAGAAEPEIILSRSLATDLFPQGNALGRRVMVRRGTDRVPFLVVGIVQDVRSRGPAQEDADDAVFYEPLDARPADALGFAVRAEGGTAELSAAVRGVAQSVDPSVPPFGMRTTGEAVATTLAARRAVGLLSGLFGAAAALLAALGVYGVVSQAVARQRRELGIRLALGAEAGDLVRTMLASGIRLAGAGVLAGLVAAVSASRVLEGLLFGIDALDPRTFSVVAASLGLLAVVASYLPGPAGGSCRSPCVVAVLQRGDREPFGGQRDQRPAVREVGEQQRASGGQGRAAEELDPRTTPKSNRPGCRA